MTETTKTVWTAPVLRKLGTIADVAGTKNKNSDPGGGQSDGFQNS